MRKFVLACALSAAACVVQANPFAGQDPCDVIARTAAYGQAERQRGVTDAQITERINKEWMPSAAKAGVDDFWWKLIAGGPMYAYKQDPDLDPYEVGVKARKACWRLHA